MSKKKYKALENISAYEEPDLSTESIGQAFGTGTYFLADPDADGTGHWGRLDTDDYPIGLDLIYGAHIWVPLGKSAQLVGPAPDDSGTTETTETTETTGGTEDTAKWFLALPAEHVWVTVGTLNVRAGPSTSAKVHSTIHKGDEITAYHLDKDSGWGYSKNWGGYIFAGDKKKYISTSKPKAGGGGTSSTPELEKNKWLPAEPTNVLPIIGVLLLIAGGYAYWKTRPKNAALANRYRHRRR